jgi:dolichol-phosphate mannosyltransferase
VRAACEQVAPGAFQIVLVDDGSTDGTWERLDALARQDGSVVAVRLSRNHGHQLALTAGLSLCRGDRVLIIDADLQDPPELLSEMMRAMDAGADVVYGQREERVGETAFKRHSARLFYRLLQRLTDVAIPVDTGDFRLISRRVADLLVAMPEQHRFIRGMVSWVGFRQVAVRYVRDARFAGETKYPLKRMLRFALDAITSFSVRPLRLASYAGLSCALASLVLLVYTIAAWQEGRTVAGWTSLMAVVLLLSAVQLIVLGVMGEYLGRLFLESKRRPMFIIESVIAGEGVERPRVTVSPQMGEHALS